MAYRTLAAAALCVALAAPAFAAETTTKSTTSCWRGSCTTETKTTRPDPPPTPNRGYLPNFGTGDPGSAAAHSETLIFDAPKAPAPIDPKCRALNACLKFW